MDIYWIQGGDMDGKPQLRCAAGSNLCDLSSCGQYERGEQGLSEIKAADEAEQDRFKRKRAAE